ncbi:MAG: DNA adenine methylase, partial [Bacteroidales bacterium]|nr:DNA adenine methylase [Bacteroidales bacterium]
TASFNAYAKDAFDDNEQIRLKAFCDTLHKKGSYWLLSNSEPKNTDRGDAFFEDLYSDYFIERVRARRNINSNAKKRGNIYELLISNFGL